MSISSKIKNLFNKKKIDHNFKNAGTGHRLSEDTRQPIIVTDNNYEIVPRQEFSESAQKAAEAALIREYEKGNTKPKPKVVDKTAQMKEIRDECNELQKAYEFRDRALGKTVELEKPKHLSELKYCCPALFDFDVIGTYDDVRQKILAYLESELETNKLEAACLIIYSKCSSVDVLKSCLNILETLINNIIKSPNESKFKRIRLSNEKIRQNIVEVDGAVDFLKAIGFKLEDANDQTDPFLVMPDEACIPENLAENLEKLKVADAIKPILYRDTKAYHKSNLVNIGESDLPAAFFRISLDEIKHQNELRRQQIEESGMLLTKQMRENLKVRDRRKYRYVLIRVLFPNNWVLEGTFEACNKVSDIKDWLTDCLKVGDAFNLSVPPITKRIENLDQSIVDANLAPCSILRVIFENSAMNQCEDKDGNDYLKDTILS